MNNADKAIRIKTLQRRLSERGLDVALIIHSRDVFYYTGTAQPCILVVSPNDVYLIVRRALDFVLRETWISQTNIIGKGGFVEALAKMKQLGITSGKMALEMDAIPAILFLKITNIFSSFEFVNISEEIMTQRMTKDEEEIQLIKTACRIMNSGHQRVAKVLIDGISELELAAEIECAHRKAGHEGVLSMRNFDFYISRGPLSSGENLFKVSGFANTITGVGLSPAIPAGPSYRKIKKGDIIIVDIPTCHHGYHSDETRTYVLGSATNDIKDLFACLLEISDCALATLREGVTIAEVFDASYACAKRLELDEYFLGLYPRKGDFIGHGIGLDANEPPILFAKSSVVLKKNAVITVEIHLTHPKHGAVKLEDVVLVTENSYEMLSITERELFVV